MWQLSEEYEEYLLSAPTGIAIHLTGLCTALADTHRSLKWLIVYMSRLVITQFSSLDRQLLTSTSPSSNTVKAVWCWGGAGPTLGLDHRDLSEGGGCNWRMMGAGGGGI